MMNSQAKPDLLKMHREVVQGKRYSTGGKPWKTKVKFRARFQIRGDDAILYVYPAGKGKEIWTYVSRGTRPHGIDAKNAPYLVFPYGGPEQMPKTTLPAEAGVPVMPSLGETQWVRVKHVDHPGSKGRHFEERIGKEYRKKFQKLVRKTLRSVTWG